MVSPSTWRTYWPVLVAALLAISVWVPFSLSKNGLPSSMQIDAITTRRQPISQAEKPVSMNVYYVNRGPGDAFAVDWDFKLVIQRTPVTAAMEEAMWKDFIDAKREMLSVDVLVGQGLFNTRETEKLTEQEVKDLQDGKLELYLLSFVNYRDGTGDRGVERCQSLQPPGDKFIWHTCRTHNRIR